MMNTDKIFAEAIANEYAPKDTSKVVALRKLDRRAKRPANLFAYSFGVGLMLGLSLVVFGEAFLSLFTTEPPVIEAGMQRLLIMGLSYPVSAFMDCTIAASRGLGRTVAPTVIVILGSCVFRIVWIYTIFAHFHTIESLYLLFVCSWVVTAIAEGVYFVRCYKEQMAIFEKNPIPASH